MIFLAALKGYDLRRRAGLWEAKEFQNLSKLLTNEPKIRKQFFRYYESLLKERGRLEHSGSIRDLEPKDLFVEPKMARYYQEQKFQKIKSHYKDYCAKIFLMTIALEDIVDKCTEHDLFEKDKEESFFICWNCGKIVMGAITKKCPKCKRETQEFILYRIPPIILRYWVKSPQRFLEAWCYHCVKGANLPTVKLVTAGTEIRKKEERFLTETEIDVSIIFTANSPDLNNENQLLIICTTSPTLPSEKKQAERFSKMKLPFIFITDAPQIPERIKRKAFRVFSNVSKDEKFPESLIECLRGIRFKI